MAEAVSSTSTMVVLLEKIKRLNGSTNQFVHFIIKDQIKEKAKEIINDLEQILEVLKRTDFNHHVLYLTLKMLEDLKFASEVGGIQLEDLEKFLSHGRILQNRFQAKVDPRLCEDEVG